MSNSLRLALCRESNKDDGSSLRPTGGLRDGGVPSRRPPVGLPHGGRPRAELGEVGCDRVEGRPRTAAWSGCARSTGWHRHTSTGGAARVGRSAPAPRLHRPLRIDSPTGRGTGERSARGRRSPRTHLAMRLPMTASARVEGVVTATVWRGVPTVSTTGRGQQESITRGR